MARMKIIFLGNGHLGPDDYPNVKFGGSVQTWGFCKQLAAHGHEVYIVRRSLNEREEIIENVKLIGIKFRGIENVLPLGSLLFHLSLFFTKVCFSVKSYQIIRRMNPDVICFIDTLTGAFPACLNSKKIFIMHCPDALDFFKPYSFQADKLRSVLFYINKMLQIFLENRMIKKSDCMVVLNHFVEDHLRKKGVSKVVRIPGGVDIDEFSNMGDENFILYAGRFDSNKNVNSLLKAFAEIDGDHHLVLVGYGPQEGEIRAQIRRKDLQDRVKMFPFLPRKKLIRSVMSKSSVFVLPSLFETFGVTILEAMACGKPVVARSNMGTVDIVVHGKNGYLYNNPEELRKYLELLLSDDNSRKKMGCNARKTVEEKYSFARVVDKYEELFHRILNRV